MNEQFQKKKGDKAYFVINALNVTDSGVQESQELHPHLNSLTSVRAQIKLIPQKGPFLQPASSAHYWQAHRKIA